MAHCRSSVSAVLCRGEDAAEKIRAGAALVQIYTGFIYRGPELVGEAVNTIRQQLTSSR